MTNAEPETGKNNQPNHRQSRGFFSRLINSAFIDNNPKINHRQQMMQGSASYNYDDYYDDFSGQQSATRRQGDYGSFSGYGGCYEDEVSISLLATVAAGIGIMGYILYNQVWSEGGRRRRRDESEQDGILSRIQYAILNGTIPTIHIFFQLSKRDLDWILIYS